MEKIVFNAIKVIRTVSASFTSSSLLVKNEENNSEKVATAKSSKNPASIKKLSELKVENHATGSSTINSTCRMLIAT
jgi:cellobiose-specific phosphotransferase system component IIB